MIVSLVEKFGVPVALVMFFVWQGWKREQRMTASLENHQKILSGLEAEFRNILVDLCKSATKAIADNTDVLEKLVGLLNKIKCLPCVEVDDKQEKKG